MNCERLAEELPIFIADFFGQLFKDDSSKLSFISEYSVFSLFQYEFLSKENGLDNCLRL